MSDDPASLLRLYHSTKTDSVVSVSLLRRLAAAGPSPSQLEALPTPILCELFAVLVEERRLKEDLLVSVLEELGRREDLASCEGTSNEDPTGSGSFGDFGSPSPDEPSGSDSGSGRQEELLGAIQHLLCRQPTQEVQEALRECLRRVWPQLVVTGSSPSDQDPFDSSLQGSSLIQVLLHLTSEEVAARLAGAAPSEDTGWLLAACGAALESGSCGLVTGSSQGRVPETHVQAESTGGGEVSLAKPSGSHQVGPDRPSEDPTGSVQVNQHKLLNDPTASDQASSDKSTGSGLTSPDQPSASAPSQAALLHLHKCVLSKSPWQPPVPLLRLLDSLMEQDDQLFAFLGALCLLPGERMLQEEHLLRASLALMSRTGWEETTVLDWLMSEAAALPFFLRLAKGLARLSRDQRTAEHRLAPEPENRKSKLTELDQEDQKFKFTEQQVAQPCQGSTRPSLRVLESLSGSERELAVSLCDGGQGRKPAEVTKNQAPEAEDQDTEEEETASAEDLCDFLRGLGERLERMARRGLLPFDPAPLVRCFRAL